MASGRFFHSPVDGAIHAHVWETPTGLLERSKEKTIKTNKQKFHEIGRGAYRSVIGSMKQSVEEAIVNASIFIIT